MAQQKALLNVRTALIRARDINGYTEDAHQRKKAFHRDGRAFLTSLTKALAMPKQSFEIKVNPAGPAVSGEVWLFSDHLFVELSESCCRAGVSILYRSCRGRKDSSGGQNHFAAIDQLSDIEQQRRFIERCSKLIEGAARDTHRTVA